MNKLIYDIADEYLPDHTVSGMDCPNVGLAEEIVNKVLDAVLEKADSLGWVSIEAINELRGE